MSLQLTPVRAGNPFQAHPQLATIWPPASQAIAIEATLEAIADCVGLSETGLYLIQDAGQVVGMTGYFFVDSPEEPYLRWHGVVPAARRQGTSTAAIALLLAELRRKHPEAKGVTELVPLTAYSAALIHHFVRLGFVETGRPEQYSWSEHWWQPYRLPLT